MAATVLLIDDDVCLCEVLRRTLEKHGFQVEVAHDAISGLRTAYAVAPDLIVLDIMMPDMDGWKACCRFREMSNVPILMLTALGSVEDVVRDLELGADDYVVKPVTAKVLVARVEALLRRVSAPNFREENQPSIFNYDYLVIDYDKRAVTVDGKRVDLSPIEFRLLSLLAQHKGRVLPHEYLLREVWGPECIYELDYLRLYIAYLRRKIEKDPSEPSLICTQWGVGYRFG